MSTYPYVFSNRIEVLDLVGHIINLYRDWGYRERLKVDNRQIVAWREWATSSFLTWNLSKKNLNF